MLILFNIIIVLKKYTHYMNHFTHIYLKHCSTQCSIYNGKKKTIIKVLKIKGKRLKPKVF